MQLCATGWRSEVTSYDGPVLTGRFGRCVEDQGRLRSNSTLEQRNGNLRRNQKRLLNTPSFQVGVM